MENNDIIKLKIKGNQMYHVVPDGCDHIGVSGDKHLRILKGKFMASKRIWTIDQEKVINRIESKLGNLESDVSELKASVKANAKGIKANSEGIKANAKGIKANAFAIKQNSIGINKLLNHFNL